MLLLEAIVDSFGWTMSPLDCALDSPLGKDGTDAAGCGFTTFGESAMVRVAAKQAALQSCKLRRTAG